MIYTLRHKHLKIPFVENVKKAFLGMIPLLVLGAIVEELFFRGFIIGATLSLGTALSVIISGTLHYLAHFLNSSFQMVENTLDKAVAAIGMLAFTFAVASLFVYNRSVFNTIGAHMMNGLGFSWLMMRACGIIGTSEQHLFLKNVQSLV